MMSKEVERKICKLKAKEWRADNDKLESPWQQIETAPKDGRVVLIGRDGYLPQTAIWSEVSDMFLFASLSPIPIDDRTYWMPLPNLPEE